MSEFLQRTEKKIHAHKLLPRGAKVLVAVSGGVDSMVLLHVLRMLAATHRWQLALAHFNHHLRGRASNADEKLVRQTAKQLALKFCGGGAAVKDFAEQSKLSVEMAARSLRHEFLARTAREQNFNTIALAHHADDQVELFFLRLLRGAGGEGLAGMKWCSPSPADKRIQIIRPLLDATKTELLAFARENGIRFREDASNTTSDFLRNRIRNELLPLLRKKYQPAVDRAVLRLMDIVGEESRFVAKAAETVFSKQNASTKLAARSRANLTDPIVVSFDSQPIAIQRRILQNALMAAGMPVDFELVELLRSASDVYVSTGPDVAVARDDSGCIKIRQQKVSDFIQAESQLNLTGKAGRGQFGGLAIRWKIKPIRRFTLLQRSAETESFDADLVGPEIILRHWQPGDRFQPIGLKFAPKLQDLFVNAKIPGTRRRELVLATTLPGEIFWVEGLRIGEKFKLTPTTRACLTWKWSKIAR